LGIGKINLTSSQQNTWVGCTPHTHAADCTGKGLLQCIAADCIGKGLLQCIAADCTGEGLLQCIAHRMLRIKLTTPPNDLSAVTEVVCNCLAVPGSCKLSHKFHLHVGATHYFHQVGLDWLVQTVSSDREQICWQVEHLTSCEACWPSQQSLMSAFKLSSCQQLRSTLHFINV